MKHKLAGCLLALAGFSLLAWTKAFATIAPMDPQQLARLCYPGSLSQFAYFCPPNLSTGPWSYPSYPTPPGNMQTLPWPQPAPVLPPVLMPAPPLGQMTYYPEYLVWNGMAPRPMYPPMILPPCAIGGCFPPPGALSGW